MTDPFLGQISILSYDWAPNYWALCNGEIVSIVDNSALYSLVGTAFGGDGRTSFGLPDLRGRAPIHYAAAPPPGFTYAYPFGYFGGKELNTLTVDNLPAHSHAINSASVNATITTTASADTSGLIGTVKSFGGPPSTNNPTDAYNAFTLGGNSYAATSNEKMADGNVEISGSVEVTVNSQLTNGVVTGSTEFSGAGEAISNRQPFLALNFVIAMDGTYPSRP
ncbi:phage tail protein [Marinoscillum furvescens]|uniref:Microcystin-dependent protein n=1 Tax=Marinoscillum furvescens DSM 4134 TaxID=1122208 RepID=A0A3D9L8W2_MARFU|nr:tail fiber protein [Marinoscillum furvescens]REE01716.1 microcystin-dependent protein [Marinoscillum furvescens DSM 4134]